MNAVMQFLQTTFGPLVLIFTVSNLATMGLQVRMPEVMVALRNKKSLALIFVWGWVLGPAFGYLITKVLPLAEPYVVVVFLASLAPVAPFLQQMVAKARGDMGFAGALVPLVMVGTVVLMPLMAPLLIKGVTISTSSLAKPLLLTILLPLIIGAAIRHYADKGGNQDIPGGQGAGPALHTADDPVVPGHLRPGNAQHGGRACLPLNDPVHGRDGTDNVSLRFRHETESAKRHGARDGHAQHRCGVGGGSGHSERGPAHRGDDHHVDLVVGCPRGHWSQNIRQAGRQDRAGAEA